MVTGEKMPLLLRQNFKTSQVMEHTEFKYGKYTGMSVEMQTQEQRNMCILHGKALLNEDESRLTFVQNAPRGKRSVEIARSLHSRIVRRPDGCYTLTFRFDAGERMIRPALISEIRNMVNAAQADSINFKKQTR